MSCPLITCAYLPHPSIHPSPRLAQGTRSNFVRPLIAVKTSTDPTDQTNGSESPVDRTRKSTRLWGSGFFGGWGDENREFFQRYIVVDLNQIIEDVLPLCQEIMVKGKT